MKKIILSCFLAVFTVVFTGCGSYKRMNADAKYINEMSDEIVRCFDERDIEALKSMFCSGSQKYYDLDNEILNALDIYDSKSTSYIVSEKTSTGLRSDGKWVDQHYIPLIKNIETDSGKEFNIGFCVYKIYEDNSDKELALYRLKTVSVRSLRQLADMTGSKIDFLIIMLGVDQE